MALGVMTAPQAEPTLNGTRGSYNSGDAYCVLWDNRNDAVTRKLSVTDVDVQGKRVLCEWILTCRLPTAEHWG
jgi:hypothetical protein